MCRGSDQQGWTLPTAIQISKLPAIGCFLMLAGSISFDQQLFPSFPGHFRRNFNNMREVPPAGEFCEKIYDAGFLDAGSDGRVRESGKQ